VSDIDDFLGELSDKNELVHAAKQARGAILVTREDSADIWTVYAYSITRAEAAFAKLLIHEFIAKDMGLREEEDDDDERE